MDTYPFHLISYLPARDIAAAVLNNFPDLMKSAPEGVKIPVGNIAAPSAVVFTPSVFNVGNRGTE